MKAKLPPLDHNARMRRATEIAVARGRIKCRDAREGKETFAEQYRATFSALEWWTVERYATAIKWALEKEDAELVEAHRRLMREADIEDAYQRKLNSGAAAIAR